MRARNREINIFNMSLLDILTGMLGAFLFLMIGLVPYYAKVINSKVITPEEQKQFDDLKKLLEQGLKGPLTPEQAQALQTEIDSLQQQIAGLQAQNKQLQNDLDQARQDLQAMTQERDTYKDLIRIDMSVVAEWNSAKADVDIFILDKQGNLVGSKKETLLGKDLKASSMDSHAPGQPAANTEEILGGIAEDADILILFRIPANATPADYGNLHGWVVVDNSAANRWAAIPLPTALTERAIPGKLYAWSVVTYSKDKGLRIRPPEGKLPAGVNLP